MIVHIMPDANYSVNFMNFINRNCDSKDHLYIAIVQKSSYYYSYYQNIENCILIQNKYHYFKYLPQYNKADKIIIHQLNRPELMLYWILFGRKIFNKIVWVIWGSDLYDYLYQEDTLKTRILEWLRRNFIAKLKFIAAYVYEDYQHSLKIYPSDSKYFKVLYPGIVDSEKIKPMTYKQKSKDETLNIVIGNSAVPTNDHITILNYLDKYKMENIMLYIILSYGGTKEYIEAVKQEAIKLFGDKVNFLEELMTEPEFYSFLDGMDVCIFNHKRQQGLGALIHLVYAGKKIFVNSVSSTYTYYNRIGIKMYATDQILDLGYSDFIKFEEAQALENRNGMLLEIDEEINLSLWKKMMYS